jgi:hypothetical protein
VPSAEGSCEYVSHPLGGDRMVDRWHNVEHIEKVEVGDKWHTCVTLEGVNPSLTYCASGFCKGGALGFNTPNCEVVSCEGC